jgi:UDP-N-acetylglucosamine diphosphorylase/glucosamine-1-phosphate N-acetyltransferase
MAGGIGKRMESSVPKVLMYVGNEPILVKIIKQVLRIYPTKIYVVVGQYYENIKEVLQKFISMEKIEFVIQNPPLGTGHAVRCCFPRLSTHIDSNVLVLSGDVPLIRAETMNKLLQNLGSLRIITTIMDNPFGYGRIIESEGEFCRIVEEKDATEEEKQIQKVNGGIYAFKNYLLLKYLPYLTNANAQKEYYLTDLVELIKSGEKVTIDTLDIAKNDQIEIMGVNTQEQWKVLNEEYEKRLV